MAARSLFLLCLIVLCASGCRRAQESKRYPSLHLVTDSINDGRLTPAQKIALALRADSLAVSAGNDSLHLHLQKKAGDLHLDQGQAKPAQQYFLNAAAVARRIGDQKTLAVLLNDIGMIYDEQSESDSAIGYYMQAMRLFRDQKDSLHFAQGLVNLSILYKNKGDYQQAVLTSIEAAKLLGPLGDPSSLSEAYTTLGNSYKALKRLDLALLYHEKALQLRAAAYDSVGMGASLNNLGNTYRYKGNYLLALDKYLQSLRIKEKTGTPKSIAITLDNVAEAYLELKEYAKARDYFTRALHLRRAAGDKDGELSTIHRLCRLLLETGDVQGAEALANDATALLPGVRYLQQRLDNAEIRTIIHQRQGNYQLALDDALLRLRLKDSLFDMSMVRTISETETRYRTKEKEQALMLAGLLQQQQARQINAQRIYIGLLAGLLVLLLWITYLLIRLSRQRKEAKEKVETLMSELKHRVQNNLQVIISILQLQLQRVSDPEQQALLLSSKNRVHSMSVIHGLLQQSYAGSIEMHPFINALAAHLRSAFGEKAQAFAIVVAIRDIRLETDTAIPIGLIVNEWVTNIFKHGTLTGDQGRIHITLQPEDKGYRLSVSDNCRAWDPATAARKEGLGLYLISTLCRQLKGSLSEAHDASGNTQTLLF